MKVVCLLFALVALSLQVNGYKVLAVLPFGASSHFAIGHAIVKSLHGAGHDVTVISPYPQKKPLQNYTDISTVEIAEKTKDGSNNLQIKFRNQFQDIQFHYRCRKEL